MPHLTPDEHDPHTSQRDSHTSGHRSHPQGSPPRVEFDALDQPPAGFTDPDPRPVVDGEEALGLITRAVCLTVLCLGILAVIVPGWFTGILLLAAPASIATVTMRHRLCEPAKTTLKTLAVGYIALVLLFVG